MLNVSIGFIAVFIIGGVAGGALLTLHAVNEFFVENNVYEIILICINMSLVCIVIYLTGEHIATRYTDYIFEKDRKKYTSKTQFSTDILRYIYKIKQTVQDVDVRCAWR